MSKNKSQIKKDLEQFATEIMQCDSIEKAREIDRKLDEYFEKNKVPPEQNILLTDGYGECLFMMLNASE